MSEEPQTQEDPTAAPKRRRRRRKRRKPKADAAAPQSPSLATREGSRVGGRRQVFEIEGPAVSTPASGRNPHKKKPSRSKRKRPGSVSGRRRRLSRNEMGSITDWMAELPPALLTSIYKGLGGQPKRVTEEGRMVQLAVRALAQGNRVGAAVRGLHQRDRKTLSVLLQCGGVAHADELKTELALTLGGHARDWNRSLISLADRGLVVASQEQDGQFFYVIPDPLVDGLLAEMESDMALPTFEHEDVRIIDQKPFQPPLDFSIVTLATYLSQHTVRLTQRHDIHRNDKETLDAFFAQLWDADSELFAFHLDFLMMHGMVEFKGDHIGIHRDVLEEFLQLEHEDQRDLIFRALDKRFEMAEWVLWSLSEVAEDAWVAERPLVALYRHWKRGADWQARFKRLAFNRTRTSERDSYTFAALVHCGLLELGQWGREKFYRLTNRARVLLSPPEDEGFRQFYLTPNFEIMAPAGLAPVLLFRVGELADLTGCDRANTFRITEISIERALDAGWKRDDVIQFLRDNSQLGLAENVEDTLKGWIGHRGDVEFHDLLMITVHRSQIRKLESNKRLKPYVLHRFAPGMYAIDRRKRAEVQQLLEETGFSPSRDTRGYPGNPETADARANLHKLLGEARDAARDPGSRAAGLVKPSTLRAVPGSRQPSGKKAAANAPAAGAPVVNEAEIRRLIDEAMDGELLLDMVYLAKNGQRLPCRIQPQRLAFKGEHPVLVGLDVDADKRNTFVLERIERMRIWEDT
ncbi:MAG: helicase-associated domain-containing protein [Myxococcota bacterium]